MKITFAMHLDGYSSPRPKTTIGEVITGPKGLLDILETRLGLKGSRPHESMRVIEYLGCLKSCDDSNRFYSRSLAVDELAVAKTLLKWRDCWIEAGWNGLAVGSAGKRLEDMAAVESEAKLKLKHGVADRLWLVRDRLAKPIVLDLSIQYVGDPADYPEVWQQLFSLVSASALPPPAWLASPRSSGSDLATLQNSLISNSPCRLAGDGSVLFLTANSEMTLAKAFAGMLTDDKRRAQTSIVHGGRGDALEIAFQGMDVPMAGLFSPSAWRPHLQLLPLALSLLWRPLDPYRLLEFLVNSVSPLPGFCRQRLADVVAEYPGIGGEHWHKAMEDVQAIAIERADGDKVAAGKLADLVNDWIPSEQYDPEAGAPTLTIAERCARIAQWAVARSNFRKTREADNSLYQAASAQASLAARALDEMASAGHKTITRLQLNKLIDQVTASGTTVSDNSAECGHVHVIKDPGSCIESNETLIWSNFTDPGLPGKYPWDGAELQALQDNGARLQPMDRLLHQQAREWQRPILAAANRLLLAAPQLLGKESVAHHPLWSRIVALTSGSVPAVNLDTILDGDPLTHNISILSDPVTPLALKTPRRWWKVGDTQLLGRRETESYSSLNAFIKSPYQWVLNYRARIRPGSLAELQGDNRQKGNLLHSLLEKLFSASGCDWQKGSRDEITSWSTTHLAEILETEGANYLLPGKTSEREELFETAKCASWSLVQHLRDAGVISIEIEKRDKGDFSGGSIIGFIDMLVKNAAGKEAVVDLKYGGGRYRAAELEANLHLQLALYSYMRKGSVGYWPEQAYFILSEARMLSQSNLFFPNAEVFAPDDEGNEITLYQAFEKTWTWRREQLDQGLIELTVSGTEADDQSQTPEGCLKIGEHNDRFCDYTTLTGWQEKL